MRSRVSLFALLFAVGSFALPFVAHAGIPFFGPIIPQESGQAVCAGSFGMLMTVINNLISFLITLAIVFIAPLMIAYSGFLFVVNPVNAGGKEKAKGILWNTVFGIVIALCGWLIVDAVMAVLYNPSAVGATWSSLIGSQGQPLCIDLAGSLSQATTSPQVSAVTGRVATGLSTAQGSPCNPATISAAVPSASVIQANLLACIAQGESSCGATNPPYNLNFSWDRATANGRASTAAGAYQVVLSSNHSCYENSACYTAAGVSGPLNCQNGFGPNGFTAGGDPTVLAKCKQAAGNVACSAAAAVCNLNQQSFAAAYGTDPYMASCQSQYGG